MRFSELLDVMPILLGQRRRRTQFRTALVCIGPSREGSGRQSGTTNEGIVAEGEVVLAKLLRGHARFERAYQEPIDNRLGGSDRGIERFKTAMLVAFILIREVKIVSDDDGKGGH